MDGRHLRHQSHAGPHPHPTQADVLWNAPRGKPAQTKELADALARARMLEGREKDALYQEFELMALRSKINTWLKSEGLGQFVLTSS